LLTEAVRIKQNRAENAKPSQFSRVFVEVSGGLRRDNEILQAENEDQWEKVWNQTKTAEDIEREEQEEYDQRRKAYQKSIMQKAAALLKADRYAFHSRSFDNLHRCPICDSNLSNGEVKFFRYCWAYFAPENSGYEKDKRVFLLKRSGS